MAEIFTGAYLVVGGLAVSMILAALKASKRCDDKEANANHDLLEFSVFRAQHTKASRFHS